ncbi:MAG: PIN domain-containing protein [Anaerolineae bacterium]
METERQRLRAVFDTNIFVAAHLSKNPHSPTMELLRRWRQEEFELLYSDDLLVETDEKFSARGIGDEYKDSLLVELRDLATYVEVKPSDVKPVITVDPDDDFIPSARLRASLTCAVVGQADYLVTYDAHFDVLEGEYRGVKITEALPFLWAVRDDRPPS